MAKRPLSKKNSTPRNRKNTPNPDTPMPISATQKPAIKLLKTQAKKSAKHQRTLTLVICYRKHFPKRWCEFYSSYNPISC